MTSKKGIRKLKVYSKYRAQTHDNTTIPEIRLSGEWLKRLGFKEGREITIEQADNRLTITVDNSSK